MKQRYYNYGSSQFIILIACYFLLPSRHFLTFYSQMVNFGCKLVILYCFEKLIFCLYFDLTFLIFWTNVAMLSSIYNWKVPIQHLKLLYYPTNGETQLP